MREVIYNCDCYDLMKHINDKTIDFVITDPPYGKSVQNKDGRVGGHANCKKYKIMVGDDKKYDLSELFRVSKNQIIFGGNYFDLPGTNSWIVWDKKLRNDWDDDMSDGELIWT